VSGAEPVAVSAGSVVASIGLTWAVPGAAFAVPGLLLIVIVLAQAAGGLVWLPVVRRRIGSWGPRRGSR
jgi:hypothetical protein